MEIAWDPEIDTPATIAVIGGGPVGVEAALYARFLGYSVMLFDSHKVGHRQLAWGDHALELAWGEATSPLGLAALEAQGTAKELPTADARVTYRQYIEQYLLPVARTDLLYDSVQINSKVISLSRTGCRPDTEISQQRRSEQEFRLLISSQQRGEYSQLVDIVLDCSGLELRSGLASGAGLAIGEVANQSQMRFGKVDMLGKQRQRFVGQHTLLYGGGYQACANAIDLAQLASEAEGTQTTWILPKRIGAKELFELPQGVSAEIGPKVQSLVENNNPRVIVLPAWGIEAIGHPDESTWEVRLQVGEEETLDTRGNIFINCNTPERDWSFAHGLAVPCSASSENVCPEPHLYLLGHKALGVGGCSMSAGQAHIRKVFGMIGGRADLDLYETVRQQTRPQK